MVLVVDENGQAALRRFHVGSTPLIIKLAVRNEGTDSSGRASCTFLSRLSDRQLLTRDAARSPGAAFGQFVTEKSRAEEAASGETDTWGGTEQSECS